MTKTNLQDVFLNAVRKQRVLVSMYLVNGIKLTGLVQSFDNYVVLLTSKTGQQVVYKHAISTIAPDKDFKFDPQDNDIESTLA